MLAKQDHSNSRVVVVTGGSDGLGRVIVTAFAHTGATVVMLARNEERLRAAADQLNREGCQIIPIIADVTDDDSVQLAISQIDEECGRIDVWVNNVGKSTRASVTDCSVDTYNDLMQLNFYSAVRCTKKALPFLEQTSGSLINIGSLASKTAWPWMAPYAASKHALSAFTHQLRLEGPSNVNFLHVLPGPIKRADAGTRYDDRATVLSDVAKKPGAGAKIKGIEPQVLAERIVQAERRRQAELILPARSRILFAITQLSPTIGDWLLKRFTSKNKD